MPWEDVKETFFPSPGHTAHSSNDRRLFVALEISSSSNQLNETKICLSDGEMTISYSLNGTTSNNSNSLWMAYTLPTTTSFHTGDLSNSSRRPSSMGATTMGNNTHWWELHTLMGTTHTDGNNIHNGNNTTPQNLKNSGHTSLRLKAIPYSLLTTSLYSVLVDT